MLWPKRALSFFNIGQAVVYMRMCCVEAALLLTYSHGRPGVELVYFCSFQNHLMYIFHVHLSAAWPHPEAAATRAYGSH